MIEETSSIKQLFLLARQGVVESFHLIYLVASELEPQSFAINGNEKQRFLIVISLLARHHPAMLFVEDS